MNTGNDHIADHKALSMLIKTLIAGILLFAVVSIVLYYFGGMVSNDYRDKNNTVLGIVLAVAAIVIIANRVIYIKRINVLKETNQSSKEKLDIFRGITITHMALCEITALLSIICFMILGNFLFFIVVFLALAEMLVKFPTKERMDSVIHSGTF